jgi:hypothetical protein
LPYRLASSSELKANSEFKLFWLLFLLENADTFAFGSTRAFFLISLSSLSKFYPLTQPFLVLLLTTIKLLTAIFLFSLYIFPPTKGIFLLKFEPVLACIVFLLALRWSNTPPPPRLLAAPLRI